MWMFTELQQCHLENCPLLPFGTMFSIFFQRQLKWFNTGVRHSWGYCKAARGPVALCFTGSAVIHSTVFNLDRFQKIKSAFFTTIPSHVEEDTVDLKQIDRPPLRALNQCV